MYALYWRLLHASQILFPAIPHLLPHTGGPHLHLNIHWNWEEYFYITHNELIRKSIISVTSCTEVFFPIYDKPSATMPLSLGIRRPASLQWQFTSLFIYFGTEVSDEEMYLCAVWRPSSCHLLLFSEMKGFVWEPFMCRNFPQERCNQYGNQIMQQITKKKNKEVKKWVSLKTNWVPAYYNIFFTL